MLKKIGDDIELKQYTKKAKDLAYYHHALKDELAGIIREKNPKLAGAIRSVVQSGNTVIIRAESRAALSELYVVQSEVMDAARRRGILNLRFSL